MKKNTNTPLVDHLLDSIHGMKDAEVSPFFYTRLKARMDRQSTTAISYVYKPTWVIAMLLLLLAVNGILLTQQFKANDDKLPVTTIERVAEYYNQNIISSY